MGIGIMQLTLKGQFNNILFDNPKISFFNYAYKKHTNYAMVNIKQEFNNSPYSLTDMHKGGDYTINLNRNLNDVDLLNNTVLIFELPNIYSDSKYKFKWIENIGCMIIKKASISFDGNIIENITGEWLYIWNELSSLNKDGFNNMTGKVEELNKPKDNKTTIIIENNIIDDYNYLSSSKNNPDNPSIKKRNLTIPLPFWYSKHPSMSLPIVKMQNNNVILKIEFEDIENLYTIYSPIYNMNISPYHYNEIHRENISINNFILEKNFRSYVEATYTTLDNPERGILINSSINEILFETMTINTNIITSASKSIRNFDIKSQLHIKEIIWTLKRKDCVNKFNDYFNYSYSIPENNEKSILNSAKIIWDRNNKNARVDDKEAIFYNHIQPYQYHSCIPKQGIYCYSYSLYPEKWFPSGSYDASAVSSTIYMTLNEYPTSFIDTIYNNTDNNININDINDIIYTVYVIQYNIISFVSGTVGLKFQN